MGKKSTPGVFTKSKREKTLELHALGLSNVAISAKVGVSNSLICKFIHEHGLLSNGRRKPEIVENDKAKCKLCKEVKSLNDFPFQRNFYLSMCKQCWNTTVYKNRNRDLQSQIKYKLTCLKQRAKREKIAFEISAEFLLDLWNKQRGLCFYTDIPLTVEAGTGRKPNSMSVDRLIYNEGYTSGNIVLCADRINTMKQNATIEEMKRWMPEWHRRIVKFLGNGYDSSCKKI